MYARLKKFIDIRTPSICARPKLSNEEAQQATFNFWALSLRILHTSPPLLRLPIYITGNLLLIFSPPSQVNYQGVAFQCCPGAVSFSNIALFHTKIKPWLRYKQQVEWPDGTNSGGYHKHGQTAHLLYKSHAALQIQKPTKSYIKTVAVCTTGERSPAKAHYFLLVIKTNTAPNSVSVQYVRYSFMG